jgi:hypothetical protein
MKDPGYFDLVVGVGLLFAAVFGIVAYFAPDHELDRERLKDPTPVPTISVDSRLNDLEGRQIRLEESLRTLLDVRRR